MSKGIEHRLLALERALGAHLADEPPAPWELLTTDEIDLTLECIAEGHLVMLDGRLVRSGKDCRYHMEGTTLFYDGDFTPKRYPVFTLPIVINAALAAWLECGGEMPEGGVVELLQGWAGR